MVILKKYESRFHRTMTTYYTRNLCTLLVISICSNVHCQDDFTGYFEPDISLNYEVSKNYGHNFKVSQRSYLYEDDFGFRARQLDFSHFSSLKIGFDQSIALGIQYRFREVFENNQENELRFTQQYNIKKQRGAVRFGNRLRFEQRINPSLTIHRFRYRFALDFPLHGEKLDIGEAYFIVSTESLVSVAKSKYPEYDQRVTVNVGWLLKEKTKIQTGLEYRVEDYTNDSKNVLFATTSLVLNL